MATPGSSFTPTPLGHEENVGEAMFLEDVSNSRLNLELQKKDLIQFQAGMFKEGTKSLLYFMSALGLSLGTASHAYVGKEDAERVMISDVRAHGSTRERRMARRQHQLYLLEVTDTSEGPWLALPNWSSENQKGFSSSFPKKIKINKRKKTQNAFIQTPHPPYPTHDDQTIDFLNPCPDKEPVLPRLNVNEIAANSRFFILSLTNNDMSKKSPFSIHKALIGIGGEPKSVKRLRSGDLLIETSSALQTKSFLLAKSFLDSPITINPHKTLNSCRGVISESDLLTTPDAEILDGFSDQGVIQLPQTYAQATKPSPISVTTQTAENITKIKCPPLNLLPPLPSPTKPNISLFSPAASKSSSSQTQLLPSISSIGTTVSHPQLPTLVSDTKEHPSQAHGPRKDSKKTNLKKIKPTTNLMVTNVKNTSFKIAREQDSPNETSPVSKKSRRRKTFKTSDAMDTDANPSDSDYDIGMASEEDESLLEADFKKVADNPFTGPLSPSSPKK
ncbi:uncharacterized protein TNCV_1529931 [Trichonephila clavipes]|uniref:Uncharacterized protein n=1 Tax=Trichonephila clavipes TaxID=2585209 RepID=A0A8X6SEL5_TRICX|nr:uncharacterized protein TNCV_1529931 [Trichonephila clavipes]